MRINTNNINNNMISGSPSTTFIEHSQMSNDKNVAQQKKGRHGGFRNKSGAGFTLIEMVVAVSLFTVVVVVSTGALMTIIDANRKARSLQTVMDNLNFAMENMSRSLRTGYAYECGGSGGNCPNGKDSIVFIDQNGDFVEYDFWESGGLGSITISKNGASAASITSPEVDIDSMLFYITGLDTGDQRQPLVTISIRGTAGTNIKTTTVFNIQTTISQRQVDS